MKRFILLPLTMVFILSVCGLGELFGLKASSAPEIGSTWVQPADGMVMMYVPAGSFEMGSNYDDPEKPIHPVNLDAYWIDRTEVTNRMYAAFLSSEGNQSEGGVTWINSTENDGLIEQSGGNWQAKSGYEDYPAVWVSWYGAQAYCAWAGSRLPTEAEWEYAARGNDGRTFPWGDTPASCSLTNYSDCIMRTAAVGSYLDGASPYGALDMAGNVWEWVADWLGDYPSSSVSNPQGPSSGSYRVLRGGTWGTWGDTDEIAIRSTYRSWWTPDYSCDLFGFRCSRSAK